jgi:hypothetical protein
MVLKNRIRLTSHGQSSTEYLLVSAAVLLALSGITVMFSNQINAYLSMLFKVVTLPF